MTTMEGRGFYFPTDTAGAADGRIRRHSHAALCTSQDRNVSFNAGVTVAVAAYLALALETRPLISRDIAEGRCSSKVDGCWRTGLGQLQQNTVKTCISSPNVTGTS